MRFDKSRAAVDANGRFARPYFLATFAAYVVGLLTTIVVMHVFKAAQPALLYLVPACLGTSLTLAIVRGELPALFAYTEEQPDKVADEKTK